MDFVIFRANFELMKILLAVFILTFSVSLSAQTNLKIYDIINAVSAERIEADITTLAGFGTRNTFSDTVSNTRGIGAARRWIKKEFESISEQCNNCLDVFYQKDFVPAEGNRRVPQDTWVVNVVAIQKGTKYPNRYIIMSGDIDSRNSDGSDFTKDAPGANDNASGMAGAIEAARVLSKYTFESSIVYLGLSGEEQGLFGGAGFAAYAKEKGITIYNTPAASSESVAELVFTHMFSLARFVARSNRELVKDDANFKSLKKFSISSDSLKTGITKLIFEFTNVI